MGYEEAWDDSTSIAYHQSYYRSNLGRRFCGVALADFDDPAVLLETGQKSVEIVRLDLHLLGNLRDRDAWERPDDLVHLERALAAAGWTTALAGCGASGLPRSALTLGSGAAIGRRRGAELLGDRGELTMLFDHRLELLQTLGQLAVEVIQNSAHRGSFRSALHDANCALQHTEKLFRQQLKFSAVADLVTQHEQIHAFMLCVDVGQEVEDLLARVVGDLGTVLLEMQRQLVDALDAQMISRERAEPQSPIRVLIDAHGVLHTHDLAVPRQALSVSQLVRAVGSIVGLDLLDAGEMQSLERSAVVGITDLSARHSISMGFGEPSEVILCCGSYRRRIHTLLELVFEPALCLGANRVVDRGERTANSLLHPRRQHAGAEVISIEPSSLQRANTAGDTNLADEISHLRGRRSSDSNRFDRRADDTRSIRSSPCGDDRCGCCLGVALRDALRLRGVSKMQSRLSLQELRERGVLLAVALDEESPQPHDRRTHCRTTVVGGVWQLVHEAVGLGEKDPLATLHIARLAGQSPLDASVVALGAICCRRSLGRLADRLELGDVLDLLPHLLLVEDGDATLHQQRADVDRHNLATDLTNEREHGLTELFVNRAKTARDTPAGSADLVWEVRGDELREHVLGDIGVPAVKQQLLRFLIDLAELSSDQAARRCSSSLDESLLRNEPRPQLQRVEMGEGLIEVGEMLLSRRVRCDLPLAGRGGFSIRPFDEVRWESDGGP